MLKQLYHQQFKIEWDQLFMDKWQYPGLVTSTNTAEVPWVAWFSIHKQLTLLVIYTWYMEVTQTYTKPRQQHLTFRLSEHKSKMILHQTNTEPHSMHLTSSLTNNQNHEMSTQSHSGMDNMQHTSNLWPQQSVNDKPNSTPRPKQDTLKNPKWLAFPSVGLLHPSSNS